MDIELSDYENNELLGGKRFQISESLNDVGPGNIKKPDTLMEMISSCESLIPDDGGNCNENGNKDDSFNIDDLLFSDTGCYGEILADSNLLNCVSDSVDFYSDPLTLYGNDENKQTETNCNDFDLPISNFDSFLMNSHISTDKYVTETDVDNLEISSLTENLENIVPNLNVCANSDVNCNSISFENYSTQTSLLPDCKIITDVSIVSDKKLENESASNKCIRNPVTSSAPGDVVPGLMEFLKFKDSKVITNNNNSDLLNNNNSKYTSGNRLVFNVPKKNFQTDFLKDTDIVLPRMLTSDQSNLVSAKKLKTMNGSVLCVKRPDSKNNSFQIIYNGLPESDVSRKDFVLKDRAKNPPLLKKSSVVKRHKAVQTCKSEICNVKEAKKNSKMNLSVDCTEKLKKLELVNNVFTFNFSVDVQTQLNGNCIGSSTHEEFHNNDAKIHYYTGIPKYSYFMALLNCLNLPPNHLITPFEMLLLTLMKMRLNLDWMDLAFRFEINVKITKETFGITLFIMLECLPSVISWPMEEYCETDNYRVGMNLYVYSIGLNGTSCSDPERNKRIFVCLSASKNPIHFISRPLAQSEYTSRLDVLDATGIKDFLVFRDVIIFDEEIDSFSVNGERSVLSVMTKNLQAFCSDPYNESLIGIQTMKNTVREIKQFKFLYEQILCSWLDESVEEFALFSDVVKVVCSLVNLCSILPFCSVAVRNIMTKRKLMEIKLT